MTKTFSPVPILKARREWWCPNCSFLDVTERADVHTQYHDCAGLKGIYAPMLLRGEPRADIHVTVREDYTNREVGLRYDADGRPIQNVVKITDDYQSVVVFCPTATGQGGAT